MKEDSGKSEQIFARSFCVITYGRYCVALSILLAGFSRGLTVAIGFSRGLTVTIGFSRGFVAVTGFSRRLISVTGFSSMSFTSGGGRCEGDGFAGG